jgi:hypothetical protein
MTEEIGQMYNIICFFSGTFKRKNVGRHERASFVNRYHNVYPMLSDVVKNLSESTVRISRQQEYRDLPVSIYILLRLQ